MHIEERNANESGRDYALRIIRENIIQMELQPGTPVSDRDLAAELGLSRTPVREALLDLAKVKIVEIFPQKGSAIALIDYKLVEEAQFVRSVLETAVVRLACEKLTPERCAQLEENVALQEFYCAQGYKGRLLPMDDEFHRLLFLTAERMQAYEMMKGITVHFDRVRSLAVSAVKEQKWIGDHKEILAAVKQGDAELAEVRMRKHLNRYQIDEETLKCQYPGYFQEQ